MQSTAYASFSLAPAEKCYLQLDKKALTIIFAVTHFYRYLLRCCCEILSDHRPLRHLLGEHHAIPEMAPSRIQRWALILCAYDYSIWYRPRKQQANADTFRHLPLPTILELGNVVLLFECLNFDSLSASQLMGYTDIDPILSKVRNYVLQGWPSSLQEEEYLLYICHIDELSTENGSVSWGAHIKFHCLPQPKFSTFFHSAHPGIKGLACSYVWWPGMDVELEA